MDTFLLLAATFFGYILMYLIYGRFIARKIFEISGLAPVPAKELEDGIDYVPTRKSIIFGHHFTSIAGTGPIVGPAIAIIWGWVPALLWVFIGSIFMGARFPSGDASEVDAGKRGGGHEQKHERGREAQ